MTRKTIFPGELFIVEYVDGAFVNKWAINASKEPIVLAKGRQATDGFTDVLVESKDVNLIDSRYHIIGNKEGICLVKDAGLDEITFGGSNLKVLKIENETAIFNRNGGAIGVIPKGSLIATGEGEAGYSMRHLLVATAYNDGSGWKFVNQDTYGFVNIQQGFGLKEHDPKRNLITAHSYDGPKFDWEVILKLIKESKPENNLRNAINSKDINYLRSKVEAFFAKEDLLKAELMDPVQFFAVKANRDLILEELYIMGFVLGGPFDEYVAAAEEFIEIDLPNYREYDQAKNYEAYTRCIAEAGDDPMAQRLCDRYGSSLGG